MRYEYKEGNILSCSSNILLCNVDDVGTLKGLCWQFCQRFDGFQDFYINACKTNVFSSTCILSKDFEDPYTKSIKKVVCVRCKDWEGNSDYLGLKLGLFELKEQLLCLDSKVIVAVPPLAYTSKHNSLSKATIEGLLKEVFWNTSCLFWLYNFR